MGNEAKCTCGACRGTGVYKGFRERDGLGVICSACNGKGYNTLALNEKMRLVQDEENGIVYQVKGGIINGRVELFTELKKREDIKYVMYGTARFFSSEYLFDQGANSIEVITYSEFLKGKLPLPMMKYTCPMELTQKYGSDGEFDCNFYSGFFSDCKKYGTLECWKKFYGDAETIEEKQDVLRRIR